MPGENFVAQCKYCPFITEVKGEKGVCGTSGLDKTFEVFINCSWPCSYYSEGNIFKKVLEYAQNKEKIKELDETGI